MSSCLPTLKLSLLFLLALTALSAASPPDPDTLLVEHSKSVLLKSGLVEAEHRTFVKAFLGSQEWQHDLWDSGPVEDPGASLETLYMLWKQDPQMTARPVDRRVATALALEGPRRKWDHAVTSARYKFFRERFALGRLNVHYADLSVFEKRFLAHGVQHLHFNTIESLEYLNDEVSLPAEKYTGACWYPRYLSDNPFGDSIHGPLYYRPFQDSWSSPAEMVRNVGGVCGSLSNFGAAAAVANGVPAVTMGEPGHCAFAVRTAPGQWTPAYSLSWRRGMHTTFYGGSWGWHQLNTTAYGSREAAHRSGDLRRLVQYYLDQANTKRALETLRFARTSYPLHLENWLFSVQTLKESEAPLQQWQTLHQDVIQHLAPLSGEVAFHLFDRHIYEQVLPEGEDAVARRSQILLAYHYAFKDWGTGRWDFNHALRRQIEHLRGPEQMRDQFMVQAFTIHAKENVYAPIILEEQLRIVGEDERRRQQYIANISRELKKNGGENGYEEMVKSMARKVLPYAAAQGDRSTFQFVGRMASEFYEPIDIQPEPFPGILLSSGGTFAIQQPGNRWDAPEQHWGVIEPHGGYFHTNQKPATATVRLGNFGRLSGVVIVTRPGHIERIENAVLEVSAEGREWTPVHTFKAHQRVHRIDLRSKNINAGYVRVVQPNHPHLHFNKFHVYGIKQN